MVWYKDLKLKDPHKNTWKSWVTRRPRTLNNIKGRNGEITSREITTTIFIPTTYDSRLLKMIREEDEAISKDMDWGIKFMEKSGTPLMNSFMTKFPLSDGCPKAGKCHMCTGNGVKCGVKSVVYKASCSWCKINKPQNTEMAPHVYIGETCRPVRERCIEHRDNLLKWRKESFWLEHWILSHGTETECPQFEFEVVATLSDPLQRQLAEALLILDHGTLNRRQEYNLNDLCRLEPNYSENEIEEKGREISLRKRSYESMLTDFKMLMERIGYKLPPSKSNINCLNFAPSRSSRKRKLPESGAMDLSCEMEERKRCRGLETSTPISYRCTPAIPDSDLESPIGADKGDSDKSQNGGDSDIGNSGVDVNSPTGISQEMTGVQVKKKTRLNTKFKTS